MLVLGIDPGLSRCGYGVVEVGGYGAGEARGYGAVARSQTELVSAGVIRTSPQQSTPNRLALLQTEFDTLIAEHHPSVVAIERVFFTDNVSTAMGVAQAAGLVMAAGISSGAEVVEYTPNQVKIAVAGWGDAPKEQIQRMVQMLLHLPEKLKPADTADAVAVALCHLAHRGIASKTTTRASTASTTRANTASPATASPARTSPARQAQ